MRVLRTILGMLMLTIGIPALLLSAGLWAAMQHRDPGGAFSGQLQRLSTPGYAIVVNDLDLLLRNDASFVRLGDTQLRLNAMAADGPAFLGIAPAAQASAYLAGVPRSLVSSIDLGTGALPVAARSVTGDNTPAGLPGAETFWTRAGAGALNWNPSDFENGKYSLVIMSRSAQPELRLTATAEVRPGWVNSTAWAGLMLGSLLVMGGLLVLAWPARRREIVYVVEPSQVPELMKSIGATLPARAGGGGRHAAQHRPRTLADATAVASAAASAKTTPAVPTPEVPASSSPAPGEPLSLINTGGDALFGRPAAKRNAPAGDPPIFEASAVGAWVAETTAARVRETEARAAAAQAAVTDEKKDAPTGGRVSRGAHSAAEPSGTVPAPSGAEHDADPGEGATAAPTDSSRSEESAAPDAGAGQGSASARAGSSARQSSGAKSAGSVRRGSDTTAPAPTRPARPPLPSPARPTLPSPAPPTEPEPSQPEPAGPGVPGHSGGRQPAKFSRAPVQDLAAPAPAAKSGRTSPVQRTETPARNLRSTPDGTQSPAVIADTASAENMGRVDPAPTAPTAPIRPRSAPGAAPAAKPPAAKPPVAGAPVVGPPAAGAPVAESPAASSPVAGSPASEARAEGQPPTVVASSDDPDSKLAGDFMSRRGKRGNRPIRPMINSGKPETPASPTDTKPVLGRMLSALAKATDARLTAPSPDTKPTDKPAEDPSATNSPSADAKAADSTLAPPVADKPSEDHAGKPAEDHAAKPADKSPDGPEGEPAQETSESAAALAESARLAAYQIEAAELLAGSAATRKRRTTTASGLPAPDPETQEAPFKLTRPPRPGLTKPPNKN